MKKIQFPKNPRKGCVFLYRDLNKEGFWCVHLFNGLGWKYLGTKKSWDANYLRSLSSVG